MREHCEQLPEGKVGQRGIKNLGVEITEMEVSKSWNAGLEVAGMMHKNCTSLVEQKWC